MVLAVLAVRVDGVVGGELGLAETTEELVVNRHDVLSKQKRHVGGRVSGILVVGGREEKKRRSGGGRGGFYKKRL
jgi:hypothetical protein